MKALAWFGSEDVRVIEAPIPDISQYLAFIPRSGHGQEGKAGRGGESARRVEQERDDADIATLPVSLLYS
jgi:hypothetical protein